jgi:hypothetical protein
MMWLSVLLETLETHNANIDSLSTEFVLGSSELLDLMSILFND